MLKLTAKDRNFCTALRIDTSDCVFDEQEPELADAATVRQLIADRIAAEPVDELDQIFAEYEAEANAQSAMWERRFGRLLWWTAAAGTVAVIEFGLLVAKAW